MFEHLFESVNSTVSLLAGFHGSCLPVDGEPAEEQEIAERLVVTDRTVEAHVVRILSKLDIAETAGHRRVLAILAHLREAAESTA